MTVVVEEFVVSLLDQRFHFAEEHLIFGERFDEQLVDLRFLHK
jgi:hypothetical protein